VCGDAGHDALGVDFCLVYLRLQRDKLVSEKLKTLDSFSVAEGSGEHRCAKLDALDIAHERGSDRL
jgi:hypothetical protein